MPLHERQGCRDRAAFKRNPYGTELAAMLAIASVLYLAYGGVRQLMSSAACAPGRPEMSLRAFALGAFGTSCIERPSS